MMMNTMERPAWLERRPLPRGASRALSNSLPCWHSHPHVRRNAQLSLLRYVRCVADAYIQQKMWSRYNTITLEWSSKYNYIYTAFITLSVMANGTWYVPLASLKQLASAGMARTASPWRVRSRTRRLKLQALSNERPD